MSGPGASQHFQGFVLKVFTPWPILRIVCIWLVLLIVCIVERGNEKRPLSLQRNSQNRRSSDIQAPCREQRNFLHATLWEKRGKGSNLVMRYSTKTVCGYSAPAAQETLLLSGAGCGSDSLCLKILWMEIGLKNGKCTESAHVMRLNTCSIN